MKETVSCKFTSVFHNILKYNFMIAFPSLISWVNKNSAHYRTTRILQIFSQIMTEN